MNTIPLSPDIGQQIRQLRRERGLTQQQLADQSNLDRTSILSIERGYHDPLLANLTAIFQALDYQLTLAPLPPA